MRLLAVSSDSSLVGLPRDRHKAMIFSMSLSLCSRRCRTLLVSTGRNQKCDEPARAAAAITFQSGNGALHRDAYNLLGTTVALYVVAGV